MVALEGQHTAKLTNAFSKEVPSSINRERIWGVFEAEAKSKSSVRMKTMLGRSVGASASSSWGVPAAEQLAIRRRETIRQTRTPKKKSALLLVLNVVISLRIILKHLFGDRWIICGSHESTRLGTPFPRWDSSCSPSSGHHRPRIGKNDADAVRASVEPSESGG